MNDFFFGKLDKGNSLYVSQFKDAVANVPANNVAPHIERLLVDVKGLLIMPTGVTYEKLDNIIGAIGSDNISKLEIFTTTTESETTEYTYSIDIYMVNGIVRVLGMWADYRSNRFDEVISDMLGGIYKANLQKRTAVNVKGLNLKCLTDDLETVVKAFMEKAGNHESITARLGRNIKALENWIAERQ